ncbi:uncharacterized protein LOC144859722 isoform X2 [Branchiostoma floridae x Branchiostoma japonicum]
MARKFSGYSTCAVTYDIKHGGDGISRSSKTNSPLGPHGEVVVPRRCCLCSEVGEDREVSSRVGVVGVSRTGKKTGLCFWEKLLLRELLCSMVRNSQEALLHHQHIIR